MAMFRLAPCIHASTYSMHDAHVHACGLYTLSIRTRVSILSVYEPADEKRALMSFFGKNDIFE